ncbi:MAG: biosynthetic-type acetolactate synthase large subunit [Gammaproteobacteria bacterium]
MNRSGAQALMQALVDQGTEMIFGYPGGAIMPTYDALYDVREHLRHILVRHEQGAVHAAQGYARASGRVGVCLVTSGPGATNLITGLSDALIDSTPLVCITGQVRSELLGSDAFQEADVIALTLAATKWSYQITDPTEVPAVIEQAFRIACSGRPGPVLIDFSRDAQAGLCEDVPSTSREGIFNPYYQHWQPAVQRLDEVALAQAASLINNAQKPLLMVGQGVLLARAEQSLGTLVAKTGIPVAATLLGLSALSCDHPQYVGMLGMHGNVGPNRLTNEADVILAVGMRFDDRVTGCLERYARQAKIIHIDIDPAEINRHVPAEIGLVGDAKAVLEHLLPLLDERQHDTWLRCFQRENSEEYREVIATELEPGSRELRMGEVIDRLSVQSAGEAIVVSDVGQHQMQAARYYRFNCPRSHITSGGAGTMGFALPAALGAKLAMPKRQVIAIIGDGGFQMTLQELGTIAQERVPVKIVILNNHHLGMVRQWQELFFDQRYSFVHMQSPDFVTLAQAYGIAGRRVSERADLDMALTELLADDEPRLLEVSVAQMGNVFPMVPTGAAVSDIRLR